MRDFYFTLKEKEVFYLCMARTRANRKIWRVSGVLAFPRDG